MKDVVGQFITYYPVSSMKTGTDPIYQEAIDKIFENPIKLDVLSDQNKRENAVGNFASYQAKSLIELHFHLKDLRDKSVNISIGDFFLYGDEMYEIIDAYETNNVFGQEEYKYELYVQGNMVGNGQASVANLRKQLIDTKTFEGHNAKTFTQQRGLSETPEGVTNDYRAVRDQLGDALPPIALEEGPREVVPTPSGKRNSIYNG